MATRSALIKRERVLETRVEMLVGSDRWARLRDWTAWMASMLKTRPLTRGPRLSRGPHRIRKRLAVELFRLDFGRWVLRKVVGFGCREVAMDE